MQQVSVAEKVDMEKSPEFDSANAKLAVFERRWFYFFVKRTFDIAASLGGLVFLSPIFLITAIAIFLDDPGPVLFFQDRNGKDGKIFRILKFRSMYQNADKIRFQLESRNDLDGPAFKMRDDPRVTRVGRFIRRRSIDELPQLVNVLRGEMSLVGPRPLPTYETEKLTPQQKQRMQVKPGITCYWQISGRSDTSFEEWMEMDMKYIREASVWVDIKTIFKTVVCICGSGGGKGAY